MPKKIVASGAEGTGLTRETKNDDYSPFLKIHMKLWFFLLCCCGVVWINGACRGVSTNKSWSSMPNHRANS
jgi:hypothetical protein